MSSIPFRVTHRRTSTSGRIPSLNTLLTGELYLQLADELIYFKNADQDRLITVITDASGNGLEKIKFSGASNLDIPYWSGSRFYPTGISSFVQVNQTGSFVVSTQITNFVSKSETGNFITTAQTGSFGGGNVDLSSYALKSQTGNFITTAQTGAFGGAGVDLSSYITTGQTGLYAPAALTGDFITTGQTGVFALASNTGSFVTTGQTGVFALASDTGSFVTTGQTGVFALASNTGSFVTTGQTGVFALASDTGSFVTTGQTGVFALASNTGSFVTTGQTGVFALASNTGTFVTTGQTGVFALASNTGSFVTTGQTGVFALASDTGSFVTTGQTGVFALASNTGSFVTTGQTGVFALASNTGSFASLDGSNYLRTIQIPNITGDICINAGTNNSTVYKIQGFPVSNQQPTIGQTLQFDGQYWQPGALPAGGNGGGGVVYYFNADVTPDSPITNLPSGKFEIKELGRSASANLTTFTSNILSQVSYDLIAEFVTDVLDPNANTIPAGLFDFNFWANSNASASDDVYVQFKIFKYDGSNVPVLLSTSNDIYIFDPAIINQYGASVVLPPTALSLTDRLYIQILARANVNNKTVTLNFGNNSPTHVHTTIASVGGSGLVKVINGVMQNPASKLVDADVDASAAIAGSKIEVGYFALASSTGSFITTGQTGLYAPAAGTGCFVINSQTGVLGSVIIGGTGNNFLCTGVVNSIILGASGITGSASNTVYAGNICALSSIVGRTITSTVGTICSSTSNIQVSSPTASITSSSNSATIGGTVLNIAISNCSFMAGGTANTITINSNSSAILGGNNHYIVNSLNAGILGGQLNNVCSSARSVAIGGISNIICCAQSSSILNGSGNFISGISSTICNVAIIGSNITGTASNTLYVNNICSCNGGFFGNGSSLTGLATGCFITTGMTGAFGGAGVDLSSYVTTGQTGVFALASNTGSFVTTGQTGVFALASNTGSFVTTGQTGVFALASDTGSFVTTGQTGVFALASNTGSFVTTGQTGVFALASNTGSFVTTGQTGNFFAVESVRGNICLSKTTQTIGANAICSAILAGCTNTINGNLSVVIGGLNSSAGNALSWNTVTIGGNSNSNVGQHTTVIAGALNGIAQGGSHAVVVGGRSNSLDGNLNSLIGGCSNIIAGSAISSSIQASCSSIMSGCNSAIIGGLFNAISNNVTGSIILGGSQIRVCCSNTAYANNFCSFNGKYYGDGSELTGLATGSFITTGMTGAFGGAGADLSNFVTTGQFCSGLNFSNGYTSIVLGQNISNCIVDGANNSTIIASCNSCVTGASTNAIIIGSNYSCAVSSMNHGILIGGRCNILCNLMSCNTIIIGGDSNCFCGTDFQSSRSIILGGSGIQANSTDTVFGNNFCAYNGKFYGDGSALTGLATGDFVVSSKCQVVAKNNTPFAICAVTRVASTYLSNALIESQAGFGKAYLCDHDDASNDDCNLYAISGNGYCAAQFSAMILGNAVYGNNIFTTSIRIDGVATSGCVLSQNKVINHQAFSTDDACVVVEDQQLKIYITGAQTGMNWGVRLDILGMQGYD